MVHGDNYSGGTNMTLNEQHTNPGLGKGVAANQVETQLFLVRLWHVEMVPHEQSTGGAVNEAGPAWHGKVQHVIRGEAHAFTDWEMLIGHLETMLQRDQGEMRNEK